MLRREPRRPKGPVPSPRYTPVSVASPRSSAASLYGHHAHRPAVGARRDARPAPMTKRRETASIAHQGPPQQGHERRQLLQAFQRRPCAAVVPSDHGLVKEETRWPLASSASRARDTEAAVVRASSGSSLMRGSYPVANDSSRPASRSPRLRSGRVTRRLLVWTTAAMSASVGSSPWSIAA
jgi:hypothetical protein